MSSPPAAPVVLYGYWRSSCSYRVRLVLALKGVAYLTSPVHLLRGGGEQLGASYAAVNPSRSVPTLAIDGLLLHQSAAIAEYLEETRPAPPLLPRAPAARARVRALCGIIADAQPLGNLRVQLAVAALAGAEARTAWAARVCTEGLDAFERALVAGGAAGRYCEGDDVSLADVFLVPQLYNAARAKLDVARWPNIARIAQALQALPAFAEAHPARQPDAEAEAA